MPANNHSLVNEFPEMRDIIHRLKTSDGHFSRLFNEYDELIHAISRLESGAEASSDFYLEDLKKKRLNLKDQIFVALQKNA